MLFDRHKILESLARFRDAQSGQVVIIFALAATVLTLLTGGSLDLLRAYQARQKLSQTATLVCQYASRPSVVSMASPNYPGGNGAALYTAAVTTFISTTLAQQKLGLAQTNGSPFTYTTSGPADVRLTASLPATFTKLAGITQIPISASKHCYDTPSTINQNVPQSGTNTYYVLQEGFEAAGTPSYRWYSDYAFHGSYSTLKNRIGSNPDYIGSSGAAWYATGYCLEIDRTGVINSTSPDGTHSAELDCDNGNATAGNSAISSRFYLEVGNYELRYFFRSRVFFPNYYPVYVCGSTAADLSWASDAGSAGARDNQIETYLDRDTTGSPPLHWTIDGTQQLAGSNLIDICVDSYNWVERSVRITVTTPAYYWLSFAANGQNNSYGGQIDSIRMCIGTCPTTLQDNFPPTWLAANNGGVNKVLFEDAFESPTYSQDPYITAPRAKGGNLSNSYGTSNAPPGWPGQGASGWATAPYNEVVYWLQGATQGNQYISLQGWNGFSNTSDPINRAISRPFLLDPGYYNVSYYYTSLMDFSYDFIYGIYCFAAPTFANDYSAFGIKNGHVYANPGVVNSQYLSTNFMDVFMSNGQLISTPNANGTLGAAPTYTNPNGTTTASPTVAPDNGTIFNAYNPSAVNPVIDRCSYSSGFGWTLRSVNVKITKPGWYWLTFSAQGDPLTSVGAGPGIDDVKLTALGSPYMTSPPSASATTTIPVPNPQPSGRIYFDGFYITADPFTFPAPQQ